MCKVIAVSSYKGGVAKTTSAVNIGIGMAEKGKKVLLLDVDPQGDLTKSLGIQDPEKLGITLADVLAEVYNLEDEEEESSFGSGDWILQSDEGVDFIPANSRLASVEKQLIGEDGGEFILKMYVDRLRDQYDYIILDSKPAMVMLATSVLTAADMVIIPVLSEYLPMADINAAIRIIKKIKGRLNRSLEIGGMFLTMVDERTTLAKEVEREIQESYRGFAKLYSTKIPRSVRVAEAPGLGCSIYRHDPRGKAARAYRSLTEEVMGG